MSKVFVIDVARCNGCHNCQIACKDEHCDTAWLPYAAAQPETGQFWMKVDEREHGTVPKVRVNYTPHGCMHCAEAPCMKVAERNAVTRREDGLVIIDPVTSKGQRTIMDACPYDAIFWNDELDIPQKCTGCAHLVDDGRPPHCVDVCPTGALRFGEADEFVAEIAQAEVLLPQNACKPQVYYLNLPKRFVAGEIYDKDADEVIIGATVKLECPDGSVLKTTTDELGDFWFKQIDPAVYTVAIEAGGYGRKTIEVDATETDVNVGAIAMDE